MADFRMPSLGADMEDGTLIQWLVKPGQTVHRGDIVANVETDKADVEIEIFDAGIVDQLLVEEGEKVPVGTVLATLNPLPGAPAAARSKPPTEAAEPRETAPAPPDTTPKPAPPPAAHEPRVTPVARHLAEEHSIDLARIMGSGPGGRITRADVERALETPPQPIGIRAAPRARKLARDLGIDITGVQGTGPGGAITVSDIERLGAPTPAAPPGPPLTKPGTPEPARDRAPARRRAIAAAMSRANREIPHYYLGATVDMSAALAWLDEQNRARPVTERILYSALLLKAVSLACREFPDMNGHWLDDAFHAAGAVHLGVAISLRDGGLVAPAIHDADRLDLGEIMSALRDLVNRARSGVLRSSEMADPTITVTNLGEQGVEMVYPVIFPPQVAIVGFGRIVERPWAVDGLIGVRPTIFASLAADHRASDGHRGGRFLAAIEKLLQEPASL